MVPDGRKTAASLPSRSATRACNALVVGSSAFCSSPTSASAIALRMAAEGRVDVSLERSTSLLACIAGALLPKAQLEITMFACPGRATPDFIRRCEDPGPRGPGDDWRSWRVFAMAIALQTHAARMAPA